MINYNYDIIPYFKEFLENSTLFDRNNSFKIHNRRYLGNKYKLLDFISGVINSQISEYESFCDLFAGTGSVSVHINQSNKKLIANDILHSNYVILKAFLGVKYIDYKILNEKIEYLNNIENLEENYFSINYGDKYFTKENAVKIGKIREEIDRISTDDDEKYLLLTSLIYATDKVANTVGHYDAYCKNMLNNKKLKLQLPEVNFEDNYLNEIYRLDAVELVKKINCDILYLDPPYNSRQYNGLYHVLENLARWEKPNVKGISKKIEMIETKSQFCTKFAPLKFKELLQNCNCKYILVSYNNTGNKLNSRSNALISDDFIIEEMNKIGDVKIFSTDYKGYTTGKSKNKNNKERLFFCKVGR